ncbi:hypothetical protein LCGC14_1484630 [marine sediment metagenome]|uniref:Uncharacterized protein n=1 Tax=marine sediment metagenome TaxID=412755 RepID=A0A0F9J8G3_9ZZZZ
MEDLTEEITKLSKINSASLINMRINNLWMNVNKYASSGIFMKWNSELDRIWCELVGDVKPTKKKKKDDDKEKSDEEIFNKFNEEISKEFINLKTKKGFSEHSKDDKNTRLKIYQKIQKKEVFLRRLMNKQGKGTAYQEEADWD